MGTCVDPRMCSTATIGLHKRTNKSIVSLARIIRQLNGTVVCLLDLAWGVPFLYRRCRCRWCRTAVSTVCCVHAEGVHANAPDVRALRFFAPHLTACGCHLLRLCLPPPP